MPITIKRYPNRKLYNTEAKQYITLEGIARLIRQGEEVKVVDHITEEDLTAVTLTQIIYEQSKKQSGFLPTSLLTGLVQAGGETLQSLRQNLTSSLGLLRHIDEEIERRIDTLIERGEVAREEAAHWREKLLDPGARPSRKDVENLLSKRGIPTHDDLHELTSQLDTLASKLDDLIEETEEEAEAEDDAPPPKT